MAGGKKIPIPKPPEKPKIKQEPSYKPEDDIGSTYMKCYSGRCYCTRWVEGNLMDGKYHRCPVCGSMSFMGLEYYGRRR